MEKLAVDGKTLREHYSPDTLLAKVFDDIETELMMENRVVCQYYVNGKSILEMDEHAYHNLPLSFVEKLEYDSEGTDDLIEDVIEGWILAIPELTQNMERLAKNIRKSGLEKTAISIAELIENCRFLVDSIVSLKDLTVPLNEQQQSNYLDLAATTHKVISEAIDALERKEVVLLADVLEYDLSNVLEAWGKILGQLSGKNEQRQSK